MVTRLQASSRLVATVEMFPTTSADFSTPVSDSLSLFAELTPVRDKLLFRTSLIVYCFQCVPAMPLAYFRRSNTRPTPHTGS